MFPDGPSGDVPTAAQWDACAATGSSDVDCRAAAWSDVLATFGARWITVGPSFRSPDTPAPGCDGVSRTVDGPCNRAASSAAAIDFGERVACASGGDWTPLQRRDGDQCGLPDVTGLSAWLLSTLRDG